MSTSDNGDINKNQLFGEWMRGKAWERKLKKSIAHKAVDIAEDEDVNVDLKVDRSTGVGTGGLVVAALAAAIPTSLIAGLALYMVSKGSGQQTIPVQPTMTQPQPNPQQLGVIEMKWEWDGQKMTLKPL